ncbi:hypothetical protein HYN59_13815 [Flavobacterium album]|uniref:Uncharacterized protein n=1 Tax=Flavobacterium album TaxID=2175091 RepID=A0A2S1R0D5_9FLAO|nr:hypothetical protein [Flavobacterium album]AWH86120.1 hypothetical protein HYN59_13815 [Flavobacterium album]
MVTKEDLEKRYLQLSNSELIDIIDRKFEYTELAVTIAIQELAKRNVDEQDVVKYKEKVFLEFRDEFQKNFVDDLSISQKLFFFYFFWIPFITIPLKNNFARDGFMLKRSQAGFFSTMGFAACFISIFLVSVSSALTYAVFILLGFLTLQYDLLIRRKNRLQASREQIKQSEE